MKHLRQVESHIEAIRPQWYAFTNGNAGFAMVELDAYTGGDGLFGAFGYVESEDHLLQLRTFMEQTAPPRPIFLNVAVIGPDYMQMMRKQKVEPDGAANGSQPSRSETNSTSSAAGSHR